MIASLVPVRGAIRDDFRESIGRPAGAFRAFKGKLPPGRTSLEVENPGGGMHIRFAAELAFRDAAGKITVSATQMPERASAAAAAAD